LDNHMKNMHSAKEKRFLCDVDDCGKMFKTSAEVKQHNDSVHLKLREQCGECGQWFNAKHLKTHVKRVHGGAERADHFCDTCSKTFFKASDLRLHIARVHDDEGIRHACPECGKQVRRLPEHMRTVHGACGT
jgi:DNA-directed RNA polymerase subunit RPC12/RpoP